MREHREHKYSDGEVSKRRLLNGLEWSDSEVRLLVSLWKKETPIRRIAKLMGRTIRSTSVKASRMGLTARDYWDEDHYDKARKTGSTRRCLSCRRVFFSENSGNRVCGKCKNGDIWKSGGDKSCP